MAAVQWTGPPVLSFQRGRAPPRVESAERGWSEEPARTRVAAPTGAADANEPARDGRRRLTYRPLRRVAPAHATVREVERDEFALLRPDVHDAADNRRGRLDRLARLA